MTRDELNSVYGRVVMTAMQLTTGQVTPLEAAGEFFDIGLSLIPVEELRPFLDEVARKRAEKLADLAEEAKFGA